MTTTKRKTHVRAGSVAHQVLLAACDQQCELAIRRAVYARRAKATLSNELKRLTRDGLVEWRLHITDAGREVLTRVITKENPQ